MTKSCRRPLTAGEIDLARSIFGDCIDYSAVRLVRGKWWPFHPRNAAMAPMGNIYFHPEGGGWSEDFAAKAVRPLRARAAGRDRHPPLPRRSRGRRCSDSTARAAPVRRRGMSEHIAVIGAGVFGAWTATHLRRAGHRVTLIDAWGPAHSRASS